MFSASGRHKQGGPDFGRGLYLFSRLSWRPHSSFRLTMSRSGTNVSREIRRNGGCSAYRAGEADRRAWQRALRPKFCRLARHARLRWRVAQKLALQWSPEQIAGWLKRQLPADQGMQISHETIYRSLFIQTRGVLKKELMVHLRGRRGRCVKPRAAIQRVDWDRIVDTVSIRERPAEAKDRAVPGHWEGDLLTGTNNLAHRDARRAPYPLCDASSRSRAGTPHPWSARAPNPSATCRSSCAAL